MGRVKTEGGVGCVGASPKGKVQKAGGPAGPVRSRTGGMRVDALGMPLSAERRRRHLSNLMLEGELHGFAHGGTKGVAQDQRGSARLRKLFWGGGTWQTGGVGNDMIHNDRAASGTGQVQQPPPPLSSAGPYGVAPGAFGGNLGCRGGGRVGQTGRLHNVLLGGNLACMGGMGIQH